MSLLQGRDFALSDGADRPRVAIVNRWFAERYYPDGSVLGRRFREGSDAEAPWITVVGVAPALGMPITTGPGSDSTAYYTPLQQVDRQFVTILATPVGGDPMALTAEVRQIVRRLDDDRQCILVLMGATKEGKKELIAVHDGYRESEQSWSEILLDLKHRGFRAAPKLAIGDGALGFWAALRKVFPSISEQRCWCHKTANVLNKMPRSLQPKAKADLHEIWMSETKDAASKAFDLFVKKYEAKYPASVACLVKDRDVLLEFYNFPADHWIHLRTTNPVESTFATVRLRHRRTKGCGSRNASLAMVFKLARVAQNSWRRLNGHQLITKLVEGYRFKDGIMQERDAA